jgi:predicted nuclease of predicted toxin-antitoxin system
MNLSPMWVPVLEKNGFPSVHWSAVGEGKATDSVVLGWAGDNGYIVFTNDLDFGAILAATRAAGPSVIQARTQDVTPDHLGETVVAALREHQETLERGAIITIDESRLRVRILPLIQ